MMEARPRRRSSWLERITLAGFLAGLALFFANYVLGGLDGVSYLWYDAQQAVLEFAAWRINVYVLVLVPGLAVVGSVLHNCLPRIEIPLLGADAKEAAWTWKWYWPGSMRVQDDQVSWREGRYRAYVNRAFIARKGVALGYGITVPVERNVSDLDGEVLYDTADVPAYESRTLTRRLQLEVQARTRSDVGDLQGGRQP